MIRINLLGEGRRPVAARQKRLAPSRFEAAPMAMIGIVALALIGSLVWIYLLGRQLDAKKAEVVVAEREVEELAPIIREVEEFKAKKAELERKVQIVYDLKANQLGPVRIMDYVSKALPQLIWLTRMDVRGTSLVIQGEAFNTNAVANFIENLDQYAEFSEPVLRDTQQRGQVYTFAIELKFSFRDRVVAEGEEGMAVASGG